MKQGTLYASRVKRAYAKARDAVPEPELPHPDDPLRRLGIAIFGVKHGDAHAEQAVDQLLSAMVDWNEVRVSRPTEINEAMGRSDSGWTECARRLARALQSIFDRENKLSLDQLKQMGRREGRQYLEELDGVDEYAVASVALWSLGGHGIPVDDQLLEALRDADLIHPHANRGEVQAFLERHISAAEAKEFCMVMRSYARNLRSSDKPARASSGRKAKKEESA